MSMLIARFVGLTFLGIALAVPASAVLVSPRLEYRHEATAIVPSPNAGTPATQDRDLFEDTAFGFGVTELTAVGQLGVSEAEVSVDATINPTQVLLDGQLSFSTNNGESASASTRNTVRFTLDQPARVSYTGNLAVGAGRFAFAVFGFNGPDGSLDSVVLSDDDNSALGGTFQLEPGRYSFVLNANQNTQRSGNTYIIRDGTASFDFNAIFVALAGLAGDFNGSGAVEQGDLNLVLNNWGGNRTFEDGTTAFATNNVDQEELNAVLNNWGASAAPSFAGFDVPEPTGLAALAGLAFCGTRRRAAG
ncbi:MAG: hypothetical protein AAGF84_03545 [Planctomycetota bacterium]